MKLTARWSTYAVLAGLVVSMTSGCAHTPLGRPGAGSARTPLDDYVAKPDPSYAFNLVKTIPGDDYTVFILDMTSQTWRSSRDVDRPVWKHWVTVVRPREVRGNTGLLLIDGGSNGAPAPDQADPMLLRFARTTKTVTVQIGMVPNEPLTFAGETAPRSEDAIIAYCWDKFLHNGDPSWLVRLPMTKSAVRAMDAATAFLASPEGGKVALEKFVVAGGSKRGWTTWTTAAVDKRVVAIAPFVIDMLNLQESFKHHYRAYGFWAPAVGDYTIMGLMDWIGKPKYGELLAIEEPYSYRARFTMPKYLVNSTGDQFFLPDSSQFYFDELPGEKYLRYVPNTDHGVLDGSDAEQSFLAWYAAIIDGRPRPSFSWVLEKDGTIRVTTVDKPIEVRLWQAANPTARDFRKEKIGAAWTSTVLKEENSTYVGRVQAPSQGFAAYLVELTFPSGLEGVPFKFTTPVRVVPDVLPYQNKR